MTRKLTVSYPWEATNNLALSLLENDDDGEFKLNADKKPVVIASWSSKDFGEQQKSQSDKETGVSQDLPEVVRITIKAFRTMNRDRVRLARAKKKLDKMETEKDVGKQEKLISEQQSDFDKSKSSFKMHQHNSKEKGYQINALGNWTNREFQVEATNGGNN